MELSSILKSSVSKNPEKKGETRGLFGTWRTGNMRVKYLCESIWDTKRRYQALGNELYITAGRAEKILPELVNQLKKDAANVEVWMQDEYTSEERDEEQRIREALSSQSGIKLRTVEDNCLVELGKLPYSVKKLPDVFTAFRKSVEPLDVRHPYRSPKKLPPSPIYKCVDTPYHVPSEMADCIERLCQPVGGIPKISENTAHPMLGGETEALKRLSHYLTGGKSAPAATYKQTRNEMLGADFSTKFSSFLSQGAISPRLIYHRLKEFEESSGLKGNENTYWILFELLWRDYFRYVGLKFGVHLYTKWGLKQKKTNEVWKGVRSEEAQRWKSGTTGVGIVDAAMRELNQTGYMSNRTRQIVASFLCKDLEVDWRIGAEYFEEKLIDHDSCVNPS